MGKQRLFLIQAFETWRLRQQKQQQEQQTRFHEYWIFISSWMWKKGENIKRGGEARKSAASQPARSLSYWIVNPLPTHEREEAVVLKRLDRQRDEGAFNTFYFLICVRTFTGVYMLHLIAILALIPCLRKKKIIPGSFVTEVKHLQLN